MCTDDTRPDSKKHDDKLSVERSFFLLPLRGQQLLLNWKDKAGGRGLFVDGAATGDDTMPGQLRQRMLVGQVAVVGMGVRGS